ncbi:cation-dependent mannose-6-phosphate receptor-like, partial [Clytia hemisphaerica]|uniref:cation-dependent mannose-6-phosphate receptor-like n=1 Tax=Clytia hemisphaerica TaxID=252671 RepID=UPI0034D780EC
MKITICITTLLLGSILLCHAESENKYNCPTRFHSISGDFDVQGRFDEMVKANRGMTIRHKHVRVNNKEEEYDYTIAFCGAKNAVIQKDIDEGNGKQIGEPRSLGTYKNSSLVGGEDWMFIMYREGQSYNSHCHNARKESWINVRCEDKGEEPTMRLIEEERYETEAAKNGKETAKNGKETAKNGKETARRCYYLFEYNHPAACVPRKKLSGGAIFVIIVISVFTAYLVFGFLYQRFIAKAKGFDQIPNFPFWRKVGNMSADGCDFVCRREEQANTYKGMADALDIEDSDDDERDDGLLPM